MAYKIRNCKKEREAKARHYKKNKTRQIAKQLQKRRELAKWLLEYKKTLSCEACRMSFFEHPCCCDFHHIDSTEKEDSVGRLIASGKRKLLEEIEKCVPMCANCHRIEHSNIQNAGVAQLDRASAL